MNVRTVGYSLLCITAPLLWGLFVVWASNRLEQKVRSRTKVREGDPPDPIPPIEYHI